MFFFFLQRFRTAELYKVQTQSSASYGKNDGHASWKMFEISPSRKSLRQGASWTFVQFALYVVNGDAEHLQQICHGLVYSGKSFGVAEVLFHKCFMGYGLERMLREQKNIAQKDPFPFSDPWCSTYGKCWINIWSYGNSQSVAAFFLFVNACHDCRFTIITLGFFYYGTFRRTFGT